MSIDRIATGLIVLFGFVFIFWIIPSQIEEVEFGRIVPSTVPMIAMWALVVVAAIQFFTDKSTTSIDLLVFIRAAAFVALLVGAVYLMDRFGFEYVAPFLALSIMLAIGERRWYWLFFGGVILPLSVWLLVEHVLDRTLA
ncbi:tripartite tricarboxylate transporter TctB family protein [Ruegeria sp. EL01]|jgi:putative tricarboxylic transport membrane protein|uniref:tripartite tricarboxylate transporter TctB family protein n=1 Tax=Ruegeria sp. EL01 TaxID=2107578 RepID=UPI000EA8018C|nr:tripartite tricarboxylate transporter TctB family protein [Ruegeria sp. EL01]